MKLELFVKFLNRFNIIAYAFLCLSCTHFKTTEFQMGNFPKNQNGSPQLSNESSSVSHEPVVQERNPTNSNIPYFDWPVDIATMTRGFLPNKKKPHLGVDLAAKKGTPIYSAHNGKVLYVGKGFKGFGKMVLIESGTGWATLYAHLDKIIIREGDVVKRGDIIGRMGNTGRSTGTHLHFEIRHNKGPVDPLEYLPKQSLAVN